jgi:uncharacterized protein (DUF433 family)
MRNLDLLRNATRTLNGVIQELLPAGDAREEVLDMIRTAYRTTRDEVLAELRELTRPAPVALSENLEMDPEISETEPVVKGTFVTVSHVISLIVDGWHWSDILRTHPELDEDDIRACLTHTVALEAA